MPAGGPCPNPLCVKPRPITTAKARSPICFFIVVTPFQLPSLFVGRLCLFLPSNPADGFLTGRFTSNRQGRHPICGRGRPPCLPPRLHQRMPRTTHYQSLSWDQPLVLVIRAGTGARPCVSNGVARCGTAGWRTPSREIFQLRMLRHKVCASPSGPGWDGQETVPQRVEGRSNARGAAAWARIPALSGRLDEKAVPPTRRQTARFSAKPLNPFRK